MNILKSIIFSLALAVSSLIYGQQRLEPTHLLVYFEDGTRMECLLANNPNVSFEEEQLTITSGVLTVSCPSSNVRRYRLGRTDIDDAVQVPEHKADGKFAWQYGDILLSGFAPRAKIYVSDIKGVIVSQTEADTEGSALISTAAYPQGVYILRAGKQSFKFHKQ